MIIDDPPIFRIAIGDTLADCKQTWIDQGFTLNHFEAITPNTMGLQPHQLKFGLKKHRIRDNYTTQFTKVEKAIFHSHYALWHRCYVTKEPIIIIEHDAELVQPLPTQWDVQSVKYFATCNWDRNNTVNFNGKVKYYVPGAGYVLTPFGAEHMMKKATRLPITLNSDAYIRLARDVDSPSWAVEYAKSIPHKHQAEHG